MLHPQPAVPDRTYTHAPEQPVFVTPLSVFLGRAVEDYAFRIWWMATAPRDAEVEA